METKSHTDPEGLNWKDCRVKISGRSGSMPTSTREPSESGTLSVGEEVVSRGGRNAGSSLRGLDVHRG